jgi:ribosome biogenesis GTPase
MLPRKNKLSRCGPSDRKHKELILAANVDAVLIVFSFSEPVFRGWLLDKYLVRLVKADLSPIICLNKFDLFTREPPEIQHLKRLGYKILNCSAKSGHGMDQLLHAIEKKKTVITGPSGSGKSSIIRFYSPGLNIKIGEIRKSDGTGRHVTSRSHCYPVTTDTWIIDTPGLRDMPLDDVTAEEVSRGFKEFKEYAGRCLFRNCQHIQEEGCAVREAVVHKHIPKFRYHSYLRIRNEI